MMNLRLVSLLGIVPGLLTFGATNADAAAWCARMKGGAESCGFATLSQCRATISGDGGLCFPNPAGSPADRGQAQPNARRAREAPMKDWRKAMQERRRAKAKEIAREREQRRQAPLAAKQPPTPAKSGAPVGALASGSVGVPIAELNVNAVPSLSRDGIRRIQQVLKDRGFDPGPINGVPGVKMREAVRTFQGRYGIAAKGDIDNQTLLALGEAELASQSNK